MTSRKASFREFVAHDDSSSAEWISGEMRVLPALTDAQRAVRERILAALGEYVEMNEMGLVIAGPFAVRMPEEMDRAREPDVLYVPNEFAETIRADYVDSHGVALAIEISDAQSRQLDHVEKFEDYQRAGIPEFWVLDVDLRRALFYALSDARYERVHPDEDGVFQSHAVRGFAVAVAQFFEPPSDA